MRLYKDCNFLLLVFSPWLCEDTDLPIASGTLVDDNGTTIMLSVIALFSMNIWYYASDCCDPSVGNDGDEMRSLLAFSISR